MPQNFPRTRKVVSSQDFKKIIYKGIKISSQCITFFFLPNALSKNRFGFSVPKRIAPATQRNKIKRILRECVRKNGEMTKGGIDGIFLVRTNFLKKGKVELYQYIESFFQQLIKRISTIC